MDISERKKNENHSLAIGIGIAASAMFLTGLGGAVLVLKNTQPDWPSDFISQSPYLLPKAAFLFMTILLLALAGFKKMQTKIKQGAFLSGLFFVIFQILEYAAWPVRGALPLWVRCYFVLTIAHLLITGAGLWLLKTRFGEKTGGMLLGFWIFITLSAAVVYALLR